MIGERLTATSTTPYNCHHAMEDARRSGSHDVAVLTVNQHPSIIHRCLIAASQLVVEELQLPCLKV